MSLDQFKNQVRSIKELQSIVGLPNNLVLRKDLGELDQHMQEFIEESPFVLIGSTGTDGQLDVSPRGDLPTVARVLDQQTVVLPDWPGNRRVDSLRNIIETGNIGLLFLVPGMGETLRVNGHACVMKDNALLESFTVKGKTPALGIGVSVRECYFQCAKALYRSKLWDTHVSHPNADSKHFAKVLLDQTKIPDETVEALAEQIEHSYKNKLHS